MSRAGVAAFFVFFTVLMSFPGELFAVEEARQRDFTRRLYNEKDYFRAITEAKRFIFFFPGSPLVEEMKLLIADSYAEGGDEESALEHYLRLIEKHPGSPHIPEAYFRMGLLFSENRAYGEAEKYMDAALGHEKSPAILRKKAGEWLVLLSLLMDRDRGEVRETIRRLGLGRRSDMLGMAEEYASLDRKSPGIAGALSAALPGAGQLYLGRKRDALAALILNGVFIWGIVESFDGDNEAVGVLLLVFELGWYGGNVYTAVNGAHKHNRKLKDSFRNRFAIGLNLKVSGHGNPSPGIVLSYRF
jgi:tetratricopeptide (TPR) repeat protein